MTPSEIPQLAELRRAFPTLREVNAERRRVEARLADCDTVGGNARRYARKLALLEMWRDELLNPNLL